MSGTLYRVPAHGEVTVHRYEGLGSPGLEQLQKLVGGYIERIRVRFDGRVRDAYVDEEFCYKHPEVHHRVMEALAPPFSPTFNVIMGPAVIWVPDPKVKKPKKEAQS